MREIIRTGGSPHLRGYPHLPEVFHLHANKLLGHHRPRWKRQSIIFYRSKQVKAQELNFLQLSAICILPLLHFVRSRPCNSVRSKIPMFSYFILWLPLVRLKIERDNNFLKNWFLLKRGRRDSHTKKTGILVGN